MNKLYAGVGMGILKIAALFAAVWLLYQLIGPQLAPGPYHNPPWISSRVVMWILGELHLMFAAFVLGVPMFAVITEVIGIWTRDERYDRLAHEFIALSTLAFTITAILGSLVLLALLLFYPYFFSFMTKIFKPTYWLYLSLLLGEAIYVYVYYYSWPILKGSRFAKWMHVLCGVLLNLFGTGIMFVADAWATYMMSPQGTTATGEVLSLWQAVHNLTWMPINIHRLIANIAFGGFVVGAYAAVKFLTSKTHQERAHYDWMGYVGNFIGICGMIPLPFAGYWLAKEVYAFNQTMGISMMGGIFSWLFILQAILIGILFLGGNYYLWIAMQRIPGAGRYQGAVKYLAAVMVACFGIWLTPHNPPMSALEQSRIGGAFHPLVGVFGVMSAKMTAVNIIILFTFLSFMLYRSANKEIPGGLGTLAKWLIYSIYAAATGAILYIGVKGYSVPSEVRVEILSPIQVGVVLAAMFLILMLSLLSERKARSLGEVEWGKMPDRSQYALLSMAISITLLMALMGYLRSGLRQNYHVYGILQDTSAGAFTPTLGYASQIMALCVILFWALVAFVFWIGTRKKEAMAHA